MKPSGTTKKKNTWELFKKEVEKNEQQSSVTPQQVTDNHSTHPPNHPTHSTPPKHPQPASTIPPTHSVPSLPSSSTHHEPIQVPQSPQIPTTKDPLRTFPLTEVSG